MKFFSSRLLLGVIVVALAAMSAGCCEPGDFLCLLFYGFGGG
jgi:hypothetical protein